MALIAIGLVVLAGWCLHSEILMAVVPGHVSMKANTALGLLFSGIAMALALNAPGTEVSGSIRAWSRFFGAFSGALGLLTLLEYRLHVNLHIDELIFRDLKQVVDPGRMARISAVFLVASGLALVLFTGARYAKLISQALGVALTAGAFVSIVGYLYGVPVLYGAIGYNSMALHTGVGFLLLGVGISIGNPSSALAGILSAKEAGGWLARRLLPFVILLPVLLGWLYLRPAVNFHRPRFAMAMFAVTLVVAGSASLCLLAHMVNRLERQRDEVLRVRLQSEAAVRQSERELRLVIDHLPTLLSYIDADWRFVRINRTYEHWLGRPASEMVGQSMLEVLGAAYWERTQNHRNRALSGETVTFETAYPTVRGERHAQVTYAPDCDDRGRVRGVACMVLDVEDQRLAESALRQSEKLAVVGRLASSIAHEINNPLEAVTNLLYLAEQETAPVSGPGSMAWQCVTQAQEQLARVSQIATQTLRFHRQSTSPTRCQVAALVEDVLMLYAGKLVHSRIQVERRFGEQQPLLCREGEIRQVLANLIGNAIDAMKTGGRLLVRTRSATDWRSGRDGVAVTVADTGHGIGPEILKKLFEPFHTTKGETGSGLGLWVSKEIVDRHGGTLAVRCRVAESASGTVFRVFLPFESAMASA